jgi:hypothetical protein
MENRFQNDGRYLIESIEHSSPSSPDEVLTSHNVIFLQLPFRCHPNTRILFLFQVQNFRPASIQAFTAMNLYLTQNVTRHPGQSMALSSFISSYHEDLSPLPRTRAF